VSDLKIPGNLTVLTSEDEVVVSVVPPQVLRVEEEEAEAAEEAGEEGAEGEGEEGRGEGSEESPAGE